MKRSEAPQVTEGRGQNLTDGVSGQRQMQQAGHVGKVLPPDSWVAPKHTSGWFQDMFQAKT